MNIASKLLAASLLLLTLAACPDERGDRVDRLLSEWDKPDSPGAAAAVFRDGKIVYKRGYGMANLEHGIPNTPATVFRIASTSKQFTAACAAILALEGKLSLDDPVTSHIAELPGVYGGVKIRHLIHHTSGIRDYLTLFYTAGLGDADFFTAEDAMAMLARQKALNFQPGSEQLYSNSGYFLLGEIVKRVSGKTLARFAEERIFAPLGMESTHFHDDHRMIVKNRADGYSKGEGGFGIDKTNLEIVGDGAVFTTVEDFYLWDREFYDKKLLPGLIEMITAVGELDDGKKLNYAFGLGMGDYRGLATVSHGGAFVGFRAQFLRFPEQRFTVVVLANLSSINPDRLCRRIADIYLEGSFTEPVPGERERASQQAQQGAEASEIGTEKLGEYTGRYYSEELDTAYLVVLKEGKLYLDYRNAPRENLEARAEDRFGIGNADFTFSRDPQGEVSGFTLDAGRVRGIGFVKAAAASK